MNMSDIYTYKDGLRNSIIRTYNCGYFPVAIAKPKEKAYIHGLRNSILPECYSMYRIFSLKLYYCIQLLQMTISAMHKELSDYKLQWVPRNESFNKLSYIKKEPDGIIDEVFAVMKRLCERKTITVSENYWYSIDYKITENEWSNIIAPADCSNTVNIIVDTEDVNKVYAQENWFASETYKIKNVRYDWEEIKGYFVKLSLTDMELLHGSRINRYTMQDLRLFEACEKMDIEGIDKALREGANVLSVNEEGESVVYKCIEAMSDYSPEEDDIASEWTWENKLRRLEKCVDYLLDCGADINLYGFGCMCSPLCGVHYHGNSSVMELLLSRGANPNYNTNFEDMCASGDEWYIRSSVLGLVYDAINIDGNKDGEEQEKMLKRHGAQLYVDGFNPETSMVDE